MPTTGGLFVIPHTVGVRVAFQDRVPGEVSCAEQGGAHLANTAAYAFDGFITQDDEGFSVTVIQADITQFISHGKDTSGRHQQTME